MWSIANLTNDEGTGLYVGCVSIYLREKKKSNPEIDDHKGWFGSYGQEFLTNSSGPNLVYMLR